MICLDFLPRTNEADAGRIPSSIEWINLGADIRAKLLSMFVNGVTFNPKEIAKLGWIGVDAVTDGQPEEEDEYLLASMLQKRGIQSILASSYRDIRCSEDEAFLGARLHTPSGQDFEDLRQGWWTRSAWTDVLEPLNLMWLGWEELFCFTWPRQFAMVQLKEGEGHTTLVGPPDFINEFRLLTNPDHPYQWTPWGLELPTTPGVTHGHSLFDVVVLLHDLPEEGLRAGSNGTIVDVYSDPAPTYKVEFCDARGRTIAKVALSSKQFRGDDREGSWPDMCR